MLLRIAYIFCLCFALVLSAQAQKKSTQTSKKEQSKKSSSKKKETNDQSSSRDSDHKVETVEQRSKKSQRLVYKRLDRIAKFQEERKAYNVEQADAVRYDPKYADPTWFGHSKPPKKRKVGKKKLCKECQMWH